MTTTRLSVGTAVTLMAALLATAARIPATPSVALTINETATGHTAFLSPHIHPIETTNTLVYVANTPGGTIDVIDQKTQTITRRIPVGIEPVTVKLRPDGRELWVSNHISDSISVIKIEPGHPFHHSVIATIQDIDPATGSTRFDEPCGIAFASNDKAYVALSSENKIAVIDTKTRAIAKYIPIPAQDPRNIAVRDGKLYVTAFESGNQTQLSGGVKPLKGELATFDAYEHSIINNNVLSTGHVVDIVKNPAVPDRDLFCFSTINEQPLSATSTIGTLLYGLDVTSDGTVVIAQTDARNDANGKSGTKKHSLKELENRPFLNRISLITPGKTGSKAAIRHIDLDPILPEQPTPATALATPSAVVTLPNSPIIAAVAAGSDTLFTLNSATGKVISRTQTGASPDGIAITKSNIAYTLNAADNTVSISKIESSGRLSPAKTIALTDPTPHRFKLGRKAFSTAKASSNGTFSCASCHPDGHTDQLLWVLDTPVVGGGDQIMPRSTMPMRGLQDTMPFHWDGIPGDPYGGINSASLARDVQPNSDPARPVTSTRQLIDSGLASTMRDFRDNAKNDEGKAGHLSKSERDTMAEFLLAIRYPPAQRRPFTNMVTKRALRGFELFHILGDDDPGKSSPNVCGDCHRMPFLVSTNTPGTGMDAPTWRGAYDRWLILPQGRLNMVVFDFYKDMAERGAPEEEIWRMSWGGRERFNPVWNMVTEGSTGYSGAFARQVTIGGDFGSDAGSVANPLLDAMEQSARDGATTLSVTGTLTKSGKPTTLSLVFQANGYIDRDSGKTWTRNELVAYAAQGKCVATFTSHLASRATADSPQPAIWSPGPLQNQRGHQVFPLLYPGNVAFQIATRNVVSGAAVFVDGRRVKGSISLAKGIATVTLDALPDKGWHLVQLQNPAGLFSNEYLIRSEADAKSGGSNLRDALLRGDDLLAMKLMQHGAPINEPGDEGSTAVHSAAFFGREEPLAYMLGHGADLKKRNGSGQLPIDVVSGPLDDGLFGFYTAIGRATGVEFKRDVLSDARRRNAERLRK